MWHPSAAATDGGDGGGGGAYELVRNAFSVCEYSRMSAPVETRVNPRPPPLGRFILLLLHYRPASSRISYFFLSLFLSIGAFRWNNKNPSTLLVAGLVPFVGRLLGNRDLKYACDNVNPLSGCDFNVSGATTLSFVINNGEAYM